MGKPLASLEKPLAPRFTLRRFWRDRSGASALEFAIIATPLILLLFGVIEVALVYVANFSLEHAVAEGARLIRTGQAVDLSQTKFKQAVCKALVPPITCDGLRLDVETFSNFSGVTLDNPLNSKGDLKSDFSYNPGGASQVVVVRGYYEWPLVARLPKAISLGNMGNGDRLIVATAAFRNEPF